MFCSVNVLLERRFNMHLLEQCFIWTLIEQRFSKISLKHPASRVFIEHPVLWSKQSALPLGVIGRKYQPL